MKNNLLYPKELLQEAVFGSKSILDVLKFLKISLTTSNHRHITQRIKVYEIDIAHFLGKRANSGIKHKGGSQKISAFSILAYDRLNGIREKSFRLRSAMILSSIIEKCAICNINPEWNGKKINITNRPYKWQLS